LGLPLVKAISLDEFYKLKENSDMLLEFVDGVVYMSPSPSTKHQRISGRLNAKLFNFLETKECEVFQAPFDVELCSEKVQGNKVVIPDLSVICDKSGLGENKYVGVPALIIEIVSPSNQSHDLVFKLNLYMQYGVKEYWIINPMLNSVQLYNLRPGGQYDQVDVMREKGKINSLVLQGFTVDLEELFR
jgi:Uma2 family endonuclease